MKSIPEIVEDNSLVTNAPSDFDRCIGLPSTDGQFWCFGCGQFHSEDFVDREKVVDEPTRIS